MTTLDLAGTAGSADPPVSVVMPAWNALDFINDAMQSVLSQSYRDLELIVVDDGSTDGDYAALARMDPRVRVLHVARGGVGRARNLGIRHARGRYIAFLDADDLWVPGKLRAQIDYLEAHPQIGVVFGEYYRWSCNPDGQWSDPSAVYPDEQGLRRTSQERCGWMYTRLLMGDLVGMNTPVVRREVFDTIGGFDEGMERGEDYDFWLRCAREVPMQGFASVMAVYRIHPASTMHRTVERNYLAELLERARERWGLSDPDGRSVGARPYRRRLGRAHFDHGYAHYWAEAGDPGVAAREFAAAFRLGCMMTRSAAFWTLAQIKRLRPGQRAGASGLR